MPQCPVYLPKLKLLGISWGQNNHILSIIFIIFKLIRNFMFLSRYYKLTCLPRQNFTAIVLNPSPLYVFLTFLGVFHSSRLWMKYSIQQRTGEKIKEALANATCIPICSGDGHNLIIMIILFLFFTIHILLSHYRIFYSINCFSVPKLKCPIQWKFQSH